MLQTEKRITSALISCAHRLVHYCLTAVAVSGLVYLLRAFLIGRSHSGEYHRPHGCDRVGRIVSRFPTRVALVLMAALVILAPSFALAQTWDGGGADNNWSTAENWTGDAVPTGTADVFFDPTSVKNCTIDNVGDWNGALLIYSGYTGTITQNVAITIASFSQYNGTFSANDLNIRGSFQRFGGTFTHNSKTITFIGGANGTIRDGGADFYDIVVNAATTYTFFDSVNITNNLTVTAGTLQTAKDTAGDVTVTGTLLVDTSGTFVVRRSSTTGNGAGQTITAGTLTVTGSMHADAQGFNAASGPGKSTATYYAGTHGGVGHRNSVANTYGSFTNPTSLGSGGESTGGGGALSISVAGTATINGTLSANGVSGGNGNGAGGSISISAATLTGAGTIRANGGTPSSGSNMSGGGGGRISLDGVTTDSFSGNLQVLGGGNGTARSGFAGTLYLNAAKRTSWTIASGQTYRLGSDGTNNYSFDSLTISSGGTLEIDGNPNMNSGNGGSATLTVTTLDVQGTLSANDLGFRTLYGPGFLQNAGGTYGGEGGAGASVSTYGSIRNPVNLGSSGEHGTASWGGGAVILNVTTLSVSGTISANGSNGGNARGSGGSVNISAATISGSGSITANGGSATSGSNLRGGGGGRVSIKLTSGSSFGTISMSAYGGTATGYNGAAGTIYKERASDGVGYGELIIDNNNTTTSSGVDTTISSSVTDASVGFITIQNRGQLALNSSTTLTTTGTGTTVTNNANCVLSNAGTLSISGTGISNSGTWTNESGSGVTFTGQANDAAVTVPALTYDDLTVDNAGTTFTQAGAITANDAFTVTNGTYSTAGSNLTVTGAASVANGATFQLYGSETIPTLTLSSGSTVRYTGDGDSSADSYTLKSLSYHHLTVAQTDSNDTLTGSGTVSVGGNFTLSGGGFTAPSDLQVAGNFTRSGGTFTHNSGTVTLNGSNQTITGSTSFSSLTKSVSSAATLTFEAGSTQTVAGT